MEVDICGDQFQLEKVPHKIVLVRSIGDEIGWWVNLESFKTTLQSSSFDVVRGSVILSGFVLRPHITKEGKLDESKTDCIYIVQVDLKGWVPRFIINYIGIEQPLVISSLVKVVEKYTEQ